MIRTILCEDEYWVRKGIINLIPWQDYNMTLEGEFSNATDAIKYLSEHPADLVITDMNMNQGDGCSLLDFLMTQKHDCEKIVISGYTDFTYTKKAISASVCEYLLKPIEEQDIRKVLDTVFARISQQQKNAKMQEQIQQSVPLLQEKLLNLLISEDVTKKDFIVEELSQIGFELNNKYFAVQVFVLRKDNLDTKNTLNEVELDNWMSHLDKLSVTHKYILFPTYSKKEDFILLWEVNNPTELSANTFYKCYTEIQSDCSYILKSGVGTIVQGYFHIPDSYAAACTCLDFEPTNFTRLHPIFYNDVAAVSVLPQISYIIDEKLLEGILKSKSKTQFDVFLKSCFSNSEVKSYYHLPTYRNIAIRISMHLEKICYEKKLYYAPLSEAIRRITYMSSAYEISHFLREQFSQIAVDYDKDKISLGKNIIEEIYEYVKANYNQEISLIAFAQKYYMSHIYLSRLFKNETGENFSNFLTRIRMEKAKELLISNSFQIKEIAEIVGYDNPYYFTKTFKKYYECSPSLIEKLK